MNFGSNSALELAELRAEQERDAAICAAMQAVETRGSPVCVDCEGVIPTERRQAAPFATRCIDCQMFHEQEKLHR
jgi:phage/conjugal plasmid C-4 type zinc finger TraR family protein